MGRGSLGYELFCGCFSMEEQLGNTGLEFRGLFITVPKPLLVFSWPRICWVPGLFPPREMAGVLSTTVAPNVEVNISCTRTTKPPCIFMACCRMKHKDFICTFFSKWDINVLQSYFYFAGLRFFNFPNVEKEPQT